MNHSVLVASHRIQDIKCIDVPFLESIKLWNDVHELLEVLGWADYVG